MANPGLPSSQVTPLYPLRRPITNVTVNEAPAFTIFNLEIGGVVSGVVRVAPSDRREFVLGVLADTARDVGYIFAGVVTWRYDYRNLPCAAVVDMDGNVHDVEELRQ